MVRLVQVVQVVRVARTISLDDRHSKLNLTNVTWRCIMGMIQNPLFSAAGAPEDIP